MPRVVPDCAIPTRCCAAGGRVVVAICERRDDVKHIDPFSEQSLRRIAVLEIEWTDGRRVTAWKRHGGGDLGVECDADCAVVPVGARRGVVAGYALTANVLVE